jgi:RNA ligase
MGGMSIEFVEFPKMARWSRDIIITEKIDGTNASINISLPTPVDLAREAEGWTADAMGVVAMLDGWVVRAGSRTRWITVKDDNFGFARWVHDNAESLVKLGEGTHFGEWWGSGIQRGYDLQKGDKRFSLFNVTRWEDPAVRPEVCGVVPVIYRGMNSPGVVEAALEGLKRSGSRAASGFMNPEGVVIFHMASGVGFKKTLHKDEVPKSMATAK